jgi:hypothetical protein
MYNPNDIVRTAEAEEAGRLYREAIKLGKVGKFDEALRSVEAIEKTQFRLRVVFRNEALLELVHLCCEVSQIERAFEIAKVMELPQFQKLAFETVERYAKKPSQS